MNRVGMLGMALLAVFAASCSDKSSSKTTTSATARSRDALSTTMALSASTTSPAVGGNVAFQVSAPVHEDSSLIGQTLEATFDNARLSMSAAPVVPQGWSTTYFAGATQLGAAPTTPAGWATVTRIVAAGSVQSDGSAVGQQVIVGNADGTVQMPPTATSFSGGSAGDGWDVVFSPDRTRVFNIHHHDGPPTVMCRKAADGSSCGAGFPFALYHTSSRSTGWIDPDTNYFWHETYDGATAGWECVNMSGPLGAVYSAPTYCPTRFVSAGFGANNFDQHIDLAVVGKELYSLDAANGRLTCLNAATGSACAGQPYAGYGAAGLYSSTLSIVAINAKIYVQGNGVVKCFDPATKSACSNGWPAGGKATGRVRPVMAVPDANGNLNVCVQGDCWALDGSATTVPSGFAAFMGANPVTSGCCGDYYSSTSYGGTKLYFPMSSSRVNCWNSATNAQCATAPYTNPTTGAVSQGTYPLSGVNNVYSVRTDPVNPNCLWSNGDDGTIRTWDVPSGTAGCKAPPPPPPVVTYYPQAVIPRLACQDSARIGAWRTFTVKNPEPSEYTTATVTIKDSQGADIAGWVNVALPANQVLDISGLTTAQTGLNPSFVITFVGMSNSISGGSVTGGPQATFKVLGDAPQMCFSAAMRACPTGNGPFAGGAVSTVVTANGQASLSGGQPVPFTAATVTVNDAAALVANCGAYLGGTLELADHTGLSGLQVSLLDPSGHVVVGSAGSPMVTTTDANGDYQFPVLLNGSYAVRMTSTANWSLQSITVVSGGSGTTNASAIGANSAPVALTGNGTAIVDGLYAAPSVDGGAPAVINTFSGNANFTFVASTSAPDAGRGVDYSAKIPLQDVRDVIGNTLEATLDPARQHLTGAPITPQGWNVTYYAGGSALGAAPTTAAGWAAVERIVTTGNVRYDGVVNGYQMYIGATVATAPPPTAASFSGGSAGDGWDVLFSPDRTRVFNVHHHDGPATVMCRKAADGSSCGAGFPFALYHTSSRSTGWIDPDTKYFWHETENGTTAGWECVDMSGPLGAVYAPPAYCPTRFVSAGFAANNYDQHIELAVVGKELYSLDAQNGRLTCMDASSGTACAGQPYAGFGAAGLYSSTLSMAAINGKVYVQGNNVVKCFDPATKAACTNGWPAGGKATTKVRPVMAVPDANGNLNVCVQGDCWALDGNATTVPAGYSTFMASNPVTSGCCGDYYSSTSTAGTKLYFPMSSSRVNCWDSSTNAKCATTGTAFPLSVPSIYTARVDPADDNCLWTNGDDGVIRTWNTQTGASGCAPPPGLAKFKPAITLPRLSCDPEKRVGDWSVFKLTAPTTAQYTSATLTIRDSRNAIIPGWQNLSMPATQKIDLSGLTTAMTGSAPTFEVTFVGLNFAGNPTADFTVVSGSPELCFTAIDTCPTGPGLLPTDAPAATDAVGTGSLLLVGGASVPFSPITRTVQYQAPTVAACGGTISGTFTSVENRPVMNVPVYLLDATGAAIMSGGQPVQVSSTAQSTYAFPPVIAGANYKVKINDLGGWVIDSITVASGGSGTTLASARSATSNPVSITAGAARVVNAQFHIGDSDGDGLPDNLEMGPGFASIDTDGDGVPDHLDLDSDGDGMLDSVENRGQETLVDSDGDGIPDLRDSDSDDDGLLDVLESGATDDPAATKVTCAVNASGVCGTVVPRDSDGDELADYLDLDSDGDGLRDALEGARDLDGDGVGNWRDLDSDNDGVADVVEAQADTDQDGAIDAYDTDSDGDGITDGIEAGYDPTLLDANGLVKGPFGSNGLADALETSPGSGVANYTPHDQNGDGVPDYLALDSDGDGLPDAIEKGLGNWPVDSDGDHVADYLDRDSDQDGIADATESNGTGTLVDTDEDGTPDYLDLDSDHDGIPDVVEGSVDADADGVGNWRDLDSDGDMLADATEGAADRDQDGVANYLDLDSDADGISDRTESDATGVAIDTDHDGVADYLDFDADGDGIPDVVETSADRDGDGIGNWRDADSDGDTLSDEYERGPDGVNPRDTDGDATPDYLDLDSDNDGLTDTWEKGLVGRIVRDTDRDGLPDFRDLDSDGDGISDAIESNGNGTAVDTDSDQIPDVLDLDTDGDGISDERETAADVDGDGIGNWRDLDSDNDGLTDTWEAGTVTAPRDSDHDGIPDYLDGDSDGDGIPDVAEKGIVPGVLADTDGDGVPNLFDTDGDNDCLPDVDEPSFSTDQHMPNANPSDNCGGRGACDTTTGLCQVACASDGDCGNASSGAICNPTTRLCEAGCRGTGGNLCPGTAICSSSSGAPGVCQPDSDGDGFTDADEMSKGMDPNSADSDRDGIADAVEAANDVMTDTDHDGVPDALDRDSDNDGIDDKVEGVLDDDRDGIPNYRDTDSDGDGIPDADEKAIDSDGDGIPDYRDLDSDNDGISDADEHRLGLDPTNADSDGDGIPDSVELGNPNAPLDSDGDGIPNALDTDSDNDGVPDSVERGAGSVAVDTDGDGIPDYLDQDGDGDGIPDSVERGDGATARDSDGDGVPDTLDADSDNDGVSDAAEGNVDTDGDGVPNYLDADSDNDCVPDSAETSSLAASMANVPSADVDQNCPASAPQCDTSVGRCVMPGHSVSAMNTRLEGAGGNSGCSSVGGMSAWFMALALLGLGRKRRQQR